MGKGMEEKVARALAGPAHAAPWGATGKQNWEMHTVEARAAIEACHHEELVRALKVYANPEHWQEMTGEFLVHETDDDDRIVWDEGKIARAVLAKVEASDG